MKFRLLASIVLAASVSITFAAPLGAGDGALQVRAESSRKAGKTPAKSESPARKSTSPGPADANKNRVGLPLPSGNNHENFATDPKLGFFRDKFVAYKIVPSINGHQPAALAPDESVWRAVEKSFDELRFGKDSSIAPSTNILVAYIHSEQLGVGITAMNPQFRGRPGDKFVDDFVNFARDYAPEWVSKVYDQRYRSNKGKIRDKEIEISKAKAQGKTTLKLPPTKEPKINDQSLIHAEDVALVLLAYVKKEKHFKDPLKPSMNAGTVYGNRDNSKKAVAVSPCGTPPSHSATVEPNCFDAEKILGWVEWGNKSTAPQDLTDPSKKRPGPSERNNSKVENSPKRTKGKTDKSDGHGERS